MIDEERLMAYLDGELDDLTRARVQQALADDPGLRQRLEVQKKLRQRLAAHYGPIEQEEVPERLRAMLESPVLDLAAARERRPARSTLVWPRVAALAATLVLGLALGRALPDEGPVAAEGGALVAQGELAAALDAQLASAQAADASTRIGVTFASADGRICRTFEGRALAGLACREGEDWRLVISTPGSAASQAEYRQAASGEMVVLQAAQGMMAGEPFDAGAERRARDERWRNIPAAD